MDHRERVLLSINHEEPDRIPTALWGSSHGISDPLYFKLVDELNLDAPVMPFRRFKGHSVNYYDERLLENLDIDVRHVDCGFSDLGGPAKGGGKDAWGISYIEVNGSLQPAEHPLQNASIHDLEQYQFPSIWKYLRLEEFTAQAQALKEKSSYAVVGRAVDSLGIFERCCALRKTDNFLADLKEDNGFAEELILHVTDTLCKILEVYLGETGKYFDIIELPGDHLATSRWPLISPKMFDQFFAPSWKRMIDLIRQAAPQSSILFHSNGNMEPLFSRLVSIGVDIYHGVQPANGYDLASIKAEYGTLLSFWGGMTFTPGDVCGDVDIENMQEFIHQLGRDGGCVLSPVEHLNAEIEPIQVVNMYMQAHELGKYAKGASFPV